MTYRLASPIIPFNSDGIYSYPYKTMLIPIEAIRREMERAKEAISNFNPWIFPWKVNYLNEWFNDFFVPLIEILVELHINLFQPYCEKVNVEFPQQFFTTIKHQLNIIQKIGEIIHDIHVWIKLYPSQRSETFQLELEVQEIQQLFTNWYEKQLLFLNDNEVYWPEFIDRCGVKNFIEIESLFVQYGMKSIGKSYHNFLASILYAMKPSACFHTTELGWANDSIIEEFLSLIPSIPTRMLYLPKWIHRYEYYYQLIHAASETCQEHLIDHYNKNNINEKNINIHKEDEILIKIIYPKYALIPIRQQKKTSHHSLFEHHQESLISSNKNNNRPNKESNQEI